MSYKMLFTVNLLNEYYADSFCADLEFVPSSETLAVLSRHNLLWRAVGHKLIVLVKTDLAAKPLIPIKASTKFSFYLKINNPDFYNFTNLNYNPSGKYKFYFNNLSQNKVSDDLSLSAKIAAYNNAKIYNIGDFAKNGSGEIFEAIRESKPENVHSLSDTNFWIRRTKLPYASSTDLMEVCGYVFPVAGSPAKNFTVDVFGVNPTNGLYSQKVMDTKNLVFDKPKDTIPVRLDSLPSGKYRIKVNSEERIIYKDELLANPETFGLIEIFNHLPAPDNFSLLDATKKIKSPVYSLRFASRSVIWKFIARSADVTAIQDSNAAISFSAEPGNQFISKQPVALREKPVKTLLLKSLIYGDVKPLPNPRIDRLTTITRNGNIYLCSEQYLNY